MRARHIYLHATVWKRYWVHLRMCVRVCGSKCDPPGFRSKQSSVEWLAPNLIDRQTTSSSLSSSHSLSICHPFSFCLIIPPSLHSSVPYTHLPACYSFQSFHPFLISCLSSSLLFSILPPSCLILDNINTSFCLCLDRIICGKVTYRLNLRHLEGCVCG